MFKKSILIILIIIFYIYLVSSDPKGDIFSKLKKLCEYSYTKYKQMNLKYHINKWPKRSKRRYYY